MNVINDFCDLLDRRIEALSDGGKTRFRIRVAGSIIEVRTTDSTLAEMFFRYICIGEVEDCTVPDAVICYWRDDCERFAPADTSENNGMWQLRLDEGFIRLFLSRGELMAADYKKQRYYFCEDHSADMDPVLYGHPMAEAFRLWAMSSSMIMLHSACVGVENKGVLLSALGGGGKSTLAVSCLIEGYDFVGDDYILINRNGPLKAMPLYRSVGVNPDMWKKMRHSNMPVLRIDKDDGGKLLLDASNYTFKEELPIKAIVHPVIAGLENPEIVKANPGPVMVKLIHSTVQQLGFFRDPEPYRIMSQRLAGLPVYEIRLSADLDKNREKLRDFISREV